MPPPPTFDTSPSLDSLQGVWVKRVSTVFGQIEASRNVEPSPRGIGVGHDCYTRFAIVWARVYFFTWSVAEGCNFLDKYESGGHELTYLRGRSDNSIENQTHILQVGIRHIYMDEDDRAVSFTTRVGNSPQNHDIGNETNTAARRSDAKQRSTSKT